MDSAHHSCSAQRSAPIYRDRTFARSRKSEDGHSAAARARGGRTRVTHHLRRGASAGGVRAYRSRAGASPDDQRAETLGDAQAPSKLASCESRLDTGHRVIAPAGTRMSAVGTTSTSFEAGRSALERHAWAEALALFKQADAAKELSAEGLEMLAEAAWWMAQPADALAARERAFAAYVAAGNTRRAAGVALRLTQLNANKLAFAAAQAWFARAQ